MIKLSVIVPLFDSEKYILETLNSILNQTLLKNEYEVIIYDDFSRDDSLKVVENLSNYENITLIKGRINKGSSFARNSAIEVSKSNLIVAFDSDDILYRGSLETILKFYKKYPNLVFGYSSYDLINEQGKFICTKKAKPFYSQDLIHFNVTGPGLMFFTKYIWDKVKGFDESLKMGAEDWDFVLRIDEKIKEDRFIPIERVLFSYRKRTGSLSHISYKIDLNLEILERALLQRKISFKEITKISPHKLNRYYYTHS